MHDINELIDNVRHNEEIARKFFEIERCILSIGRCDQFVSTLTKEVQKQFNVPYVWVNLINEAPLSHLIESLEKLPDLRDRVLFTRRSAMIDIIKSSNKTVLVNSNLSFCREIIPSIYRDIIASVAISPLTIDGELVGLFCQADSDLSRYDASTKDTFLLDQLAIKISICLSNVTAREKLEYLATRDPLTGLLNRRQLELMLDREFSRSKQQKRDLTVVFIDCDAFKSINDTLGHNCGDEVLEYIAKRLLKYVHKQGLAFRFAGDEFVFVMPGKTYDQAIQVAESIQDYLQSNPLRYKSNLVPITISYGGASVVSDAPSNYKHLLKVADERLYDYKNNRKRLVPTKVFKFLNKLR
ncbi:GGDEF domain-containing protein [Marinomonas posidonica]|uniref:diguanylate cyclase n=1 Tax=Marinomonas posidonica (strain CECT 7376 / NCIMB 14433 / IVIA-Po-181) TaxID=491952 RepID=F6D041_MARPP|nr:GGDEF domain-containing protein [Marinomonas posidonica]AEF55865.1 diguanylate cyclase [Marinomonas posidonica IVIA-Po-181]